jgi:hypothetical protein
VFDELKLFTSTNSKQEKCKIIQLYSVVKQHKITLSFKYIAIESASSGPLVHSRIFLAQYILQKSSVSGQNNILYKEHNCKTKQGFEKGLWPKSEMET